MIAACGDRSLKGGKQAKLSLFAYWAGQDADFAGELTYQNTRKLPFALDIELGRKATHLLQQFP